MPPRLTQLLSMLELQGPRIKSYNTIPADSVMASLDIILITT